MIRFEKYTEDWKVTVLRYWVSKNRFDNLENCESFILTYSLRRPKSTKQLRIKQNKVINIHIVITTTVRNKKKLKIIIIVGQQN